MFNIEWKRAAHHQGATRRGKPHPRLMNINLQILPSTTTRQTGLSSGFMVAWATRGER